MIPEVYTSVMEKKLGSYLEKRCPPLIKCEFWVKWDLFKSFFKNIYICNNAAEVYYSSKDAEFEIEK